MWWPRALFSTTSGQLGLRQAWACLVDIVTVEKLIRRVVTVLTDQQKCQHSQVGELLPGIIRDIHDRMRLYAKAMRMQR